MDKVEMVKIPIEKALGLLKADGIEVTAEQAEHIVGFLSLVAEIVVDQYLYDKKDQPK